MQTPPWILVFWSVMHTGKPTSPPNRMTEGVKTLPCPILRLRAVNILSNIHINIQTRAQATTGSRSVVYLARYDRRTDVTGYSIDTVASTVTTSTSISNSSRIISAKNKTNMTVLFFIKNLHLTWHQQSTYNATLSKLLMGIFNQQCNSQLCNMFVWGYVKC